MLLCKFCGKECKNENSLRNHERLCKENPTRQISQFEKIDIQNKRKRGNQFTRARELGIESYGLMSDSAKARISQVNMMRGQTSEAKKKLSDLAKERGLGGHTSKVKIHFTKGNGEIVFLQSSYEVKFATLLEELGVEWSRPSPLNWVDENGDGHKYYPDFKVNDVFIDTKNDYLALVDLPKIERVRQQNDVDIRIVTFDMITKEFIASLV